jgi:hypothetical protein
MKILLRNILAAVLGVIVAGLVIAGIQQINLRIHPPPAGLDLKDAAALKAYVATLPVSAFIGVLLSYFVGVTGGGWLATRLSASRHARQGMMVGVLFFVASIANLNSLPHPVWFWIANLVVVPAAAWLGMKFGEPEERPLD